MSTKGASIYMRGAWAIRIYLKKISLEIFCRILPMQLKQKDYK